MDDLVNIIISCDPGLNGAFCILIGQKAVVVDIPTETIVTKKRIKNKTVNNKRKVYNFKAISDILKPFEYQNVQYIIEKVNAMPGEGVTSSFRFGEGYGCLKMAGICCKFEISEVSPLTWKKFYPQLTSSDSLIDKKEQIKALKSQFKIIRDQKLKIQTKKDIDSLNRTIQSETKSRARTLASDLFPDIKESFLLKKHDGRAEAALIAYYAKNQQ